MATKKTASATGKTLTNPKSSRATKSSAASALIERSQYKSHTVTHKSGQVISRTVTTHRDALKRLADR